MSKYYVLIGTDTDGRVDLIFGDYDRECVEFEKTDGGHGVRAGGEYKALKVRTLPDGEQLTLDRFMLEQNAGATHPVSLEAGGIDERYAVTLEYCGEALPRFVARFCGDWIGKAATRPEAEKLCCRHDVGRLRDLEGEPRVHPAINDLIEGKHDRPSAAERLRSQKVALFAERENTTAVVEWINATMPAEYRAEALTGAMMMFNTLLELLAKQAEAEAMEG